MHLGRCLLAALAVGSSPLVLADQLNLSLNNDTIGLAYLRPVTDTGLTADLGYLRHTDGGNLTHFGLMLVDEAGSGREAFTVGLGGRLLRIDGGAASGSAVAIGATFRYVLPDYNRFAFSGAAFVAPQVTSFSDLEGYYEVTLRGEYRLLEKGSIYLGLRSMSGDFGVGRASVDDGLHVGIDLAF
jgi:hypothetical protein